MSKEDLLSSILNFEARRKQRLEERAAKRKALEANFENGHVLEGSRCMKCSEPRWVHPDCGETVLCKDHLWGYIFNDENAPPIRRGIDYQSSARRTFLVEELPPQTDFKMVEKLPPVVVGECPSTVTYIEQYTVALTAVGTRKIEVIKVVREVTGLGLKEAMELVGSLPKPLKEHLSKDDAEALRAKLVEVGASVDLILV